ADRNRSHWSTSKTPSYTKSVSWQHHPLAYLEKHTARLKNLGVEEVVAKVFDVNEPLSQINQAKLA
ncbi:YdhR family protein, partial [Escherichia coli]|nr:YdhR family protein [Escherichia coli]